MFKSKAGSVVLLLACTLPGELFISFISRCVLVIQPWNMRLLDGGRMNKTWCEIEKINSSPGKVHASFRLLRFRSSLWCWLHGANVGRHENFNFEPRHLDVTNER